MNELEKAPGWLAEAFPGKVAYWTCFAVPEVAPPWWKRFTKPVVNEPTWLVAFYSKEDAEAHAAIPRTDWIWNKQPASEVPLRERMAEARRRGDRGVLVKTYRSGFWITAHEYPSDQPLPEALR